MKFQLVFQFEARTIEDFDFLISLEEYLILALAADRAALVDGHDFGMGEYNIFVHTDEPREIFTKVANMIGSRNPDLPFSAGFRAFGEEDYTVLWPPSLTAFSIA